MEVGNYINLWTPDISNGDGGIKLTFYKLILVIEVGESHNHIITMRVSAA